MLELVHLVKRYGERTALDGVSLRVEPGRIHGFVGRNGAGKTTTMRIALGLAVADGGDVRWRGEPVTAAHRRRIGYMPEERGLYPRMTAREQVAYFARLSGRSAAEAAADADRVLTSLELSERAGEAVEKLSLGNQQRCQLAVALVAEPELLVLDEPFSGLDPVGVDALAAALRREVDRGVGVLFSSHQLDLVERLCDEVTIIEAGRVVAAGPIGDLRRRRGRPRLRVGLESGATAWAARLRGADVVAVVGEEVLLELHDGADDQAVLTAARRAGRVSCFRREQPTLAELFREVVAQ